MQGDGSGISLSLSSPRFLRFEIREFDAHNGKLQWRLWVPESPYLEPPWQSLACEAASYNAERPVPPPQ